MPRARSKRTHFPVITEFSLFVVAVLCISILTIGCNDKKDKGGSKQKSISSIKKQYKDDPLELTEKLMSTAKSAHKSKDAPRAEEALVGAMPEVQPVGLPDHRAHLGAVQDQPPAEVFRLYLRPTYESSYLA